MTDYKKLVTELGSMAKMPILPNACHLMELAAAAITELSAELTGTEEALEIEESTAEAYFAGETP